MGKKGKSKKISRQKFETESVTLHTNTGFRSSDKPKYYFFYLAIFLFSVLLYSNTINHRYAFDDSIVITENEFTKKGIQGIPELFTKDMFIGMYGEQLEVTGGRYRPLSLLTFALEYEFFGSEPKIGHINNILLYGLLNVMLFIAIFMMTGNIYIAFLSSLLFAAHPIHTEVVANIKSRDEILCLLLGLGAMIQILKYQKKRSLIILSSGLLLFYLSLLSKETAVSFLVLIPASVYIQSKAEFKKVILSPFLPLLAVFAIYFAIRASLVGMPGGNDSTDIMENPFYGAEPMDKYATIFYIMGKYVKLMFFPHPLSSDYSFNQIPLRNWDMESLFWLIAYLSAFAWSLFYIFRRNLYAYSLLFYLIPLTITSNILFNIGAPMGERFAFMSSVGFCLALSLLVHKFAIGSSSALTKSTLFRGLLVISPILILYSFKTIDRNADWHDNLTLFSADVKTVPNSAKAHYYYGNTLLNRFISGNKTDKEKIKIANRSFKRSVEINPRFHWALYNLGLSYNHMAKPDSAIYYLEKVLEENPTHIATQGVLGSIYGQHKQDYNKAIYHLEKSIEYGDLNKSNFHNLAIAYALSGNFIAAEKNFREALKFQPNNARLNYELGITLQNIDKQADAQFYLEKASTLDPNLSH